MPRPPKPRRIGFLPDVKYFKPAGVPLRDLEEVLITVDELESLRLKDMERLDQQACAERMGVAQSTFQRILTKARVKLTRAVVEGRAIRIEGGSFTIKSVLLCMDCGGHWKIASEDDCLVEGDIQCPNCGSHRVRARWRGKRGRGPV